jgi:hypothetical protein
MSQANELFGTLSVLDASASNFVINYKLTNNTDKTYHICKYGTPLEYVCGHHYFTVTDATTNIELPYQGIMARRLPPSVANGSYLTINPSQSLENSTVVNTFANVTAGNTYTITPNQKFSYKDGLDDSLPNHSVQVNTPSLTVTLH